MKANDPTIGIIGGSGLYELEGLTDVRIVEAIYRSARDGRPVTLPRIARIEAPPAEHDLRKPVADRRQAS